MDENKIKKATRTLDYTTTAVVCIVKNLKTHMHASYARTKINNQWGEQNLGKTLPVLSHTTPKQNNKKEAAFSHERNTAKKPTKTAVSDVLARVKL